MQVFLQPEWFDGPFSLLEGAFAYDEDHNHKEGEHMYRFQHGDHHVEIQIDKNHHTGLTDIGFSVNGTVSKNRIPTKDGKSIAHKIHHVVVRHIKNHSKSGEVLAAHAFDSNDGIQIKKHKSYGHFFKSLEKRGLGSYSEKDNEHRLMVKEGVISSIRTAVRHHAPGRLERAAERTKKIAFSAAEKNIPTKVKQDITKRALLVKAAKQAKHDGAVVKSKNFIHQAATGKKPKPENHFGWSPEADSIAKQASVMEEAPTNSVAAGGVPSLTDGSVVPPKARRKWKSDNAKGQGMLRRQINNLPIAEGKFAGMKTFIVPASMVENTILEKRKHKHWTKYLESDPIGRAIREYANTHPDAPIILECEKTGYMVFARYGKSPMHK